MSARICACGHDPASHLPTDVLGYFAGAGGGECRRCNCGRFEEAL